MENAVNKIKKNLFLVLCMLFYSIIITAQNGTIIRGVVLDENDEPVIGANISIKGNKSIGTIADIDGNFQLKIPNADAVLIVSFIGMTPQEVKVGKQPIRVILKSDNVQLDEVVVIGYGTQKKESVVGAITQTNAKTLERSGGVSSLGQALTGNLPGVITYTSSGMPGDEDPKIIIRAQSSWNNSDPLILVDGVEREMSSVDIASVESVSVLKDASATAVYGVKGANGVILITTKRGKEGKANIQIRANATLKAVSKLPEKYDAYDSHIIKNKTIERELLLNPSGWGNYKPMAIIDKYRNPANAEEWDRYPNVDWVDELFNSTAMSYNTSVNVSGGTKLVKYFAAVDFTHEGDLFKKQENHRGYTAGYGFNRINVRSNLDFDLTKTTRFSANLFGSNGARRAPRGGIDGDGQYWKSAYRTAPDALRPIYSNGLYGYYAISDYDVPNSVRLLALSGSETKTTTKINTDFSLNQNLDMITKGLSVKASFTMDNTFVEKERGINDPSSSQQMWVNPDSGEIVYKEPINNGTQLDFAEWLNWSGEAGNVDKGQTYRKLYYSGQINYARKFGLHDVTAMGLFSREQWAKGGEFYHYREDWVFRLTYNYASRYFLDANGAYNGSEKFGPKNRFAFFPSFAAGWMLSEESFMQKVKFLDMLKLRASWGRIGDDNVGGRWLYDDQWGFQESNTWMGAPTVSKTPYSYYRIASLGNENLSWETVEKRNLGVEYSFLNGLIAGSADIFNDERTDILVAGGSRAVPSYFGTTPPMANIGKVKSNGYELELRLNYIFRNNMRLWLNTNMTHAVSEVVFRDDPELTPAHRKAAGFAIGQTKTHLDNGFLTTWDDIYGSTERESNNKNKLPGDYSIIDFNGDGVINTDDQVAYGYTGTPQNTYNASLGFEWKGLSAFVQFYGVNNVSRDITFPTFDKQTNVVFKEKQIWSKDNGGEIPMPRWATKIDESGTRYWYDGSYLRLKKAEVAYTFTGPKVQKIGLKTVKLYLNGDNIFLWTNMPDDRESNFSGGGGFGAYPTVRRFNIGIDITL